MTGSVRKGGEAIAVSPSSPTQDRRRTDRAMRYTIATGASTSSQFRSVYFMLASVLPEHVDPHVHDPSCP